jgi:hypothetical protein
VLAATAYCVANLAPCAANGILRRPATASGEQHEAGIMPALEKMQRGGRMTAPSE